MRCRNEQKRGNETETKLSFLEVALHFVDWAERRVWGALLDPPLSPECQEASVARSTFYPLCLIHQPYPYLDGQNLATVIHALVPWDMWLLLCNSFAQLALQTPDAENILTAVCFTVQRKTGRTPYCGCTKVQQGLPRAQKEAKGWTSGWFCCQVHNRNKAPAWGAEDTERGRLTVSSKPKSIPDLCLEMVIHALVTSRLDYCNALYVGLPLKTVRILQLVQNRVARLLTGTGCYSHITLVLYQLHWLPVEVWAQFKVLVLTYKGLNGLGPGYLKERLLPYMPSCPSRSAGEALLQEPL
ncbi:Podocalyxin-like protein 2 [Varanus komodoensis]|nr:Podocalyxin-like protein 2 [Varanus komodoensis]